MDGEDFLVDGTQSRAVDQVVRSQRPDHGRLLVLEDPDGPGFLEQQVHLFQAFERALGVEEIDHDRHQVAERHKD